MSNAGYPEKPPPWVDGDRLRRFGAMDVTSQHVILEVPQPFANHNGGQLALGPDG